VAATAPDHYREAVRLIAECEGRQLLTAAVQAKMTAAQAHATLALAVAIGGMLTEFAEHLQEHHRDEP
jgi:hypothetical protein